MVEQGGNAPAGPCSQILEELGRGTSGVVYKAWQPSLDRLVALKLVLVEAGGLSHIRVARFQREAEALAYLTGNDANLTTLYEIGEFNGQPYYVREHVEGDSWASVASSRALNLHEGIRVVEAVARTVHRVHTRGFVHRNLEPSNILLSREGTVKVIGFGSVGQLAGAHGTEGRGVASIATDLDALGQMLDWLCTRLRQPLPPRLESIYLKCVAADPGRIYHSAQELAEDLKRYSQA